MANSRQLAEAVSAVTGMALPTIVDIDRKLASAGLRTLGGRGLNAARMTALDAARLIVALLGSSQARAAGDTVNRYALAYPDETRSTKGRFSATPIQALAALPVRHSFVEALAALLNSAATESRSRTTAQAGSSWATIEISASNRAIRGSIKMGGTPGTAPVTIEYVGSEAHKKVGARGSGHNDGDLEQLRRITDRTLLAIAAVLADETSRSKIPKNLPTRRSRRRRKVT
jgi:hypothetical protein